MKILAIGGAVIKTASEELREICERKLIDVLIHNGGSIFHDFQNATEDMRGRHSIALDDLLVDCEQLRPASKLVWDFVKWRVCPKNSISDLCQQNGIEVMMFTGLGCDFWQIFNHEWDTLGIIGTLFFDKFVNYMSQPFEYICMGSAVIHPEVFIKALAVAQPKDFRADVVDFLPNQYRPLTRVARYGKYYQMTHKEFLRNWLNTASTTTKSILENTAEPQSKSLR